MRDAKSLITRTTIEILNVPVEMTAEATIEKFVTDDLRRSCNLEISKQNVQIFSDILSEKGLPETTIIDQVTQTKISNIESISVSISAVAPKIEKEDFTVSYENTSFDMEEWKQLIIKKYETQQDSNNLE